MRAFIVIIALFVSSCLLNLSSFTSMDNMCFTACQEIYPKQIQEAWWQGDDTYLQVHRCACLLNKEIIKYHIFPF